MPKKSEVASFIGNFSPVKRRNAILVNSWRHLENQSVLGHVCFESLSFLKGEIGDELNKRAALD